MRRGLSIEQALAIDPNNAAAIAGVADTYFSEFLFGYGNPGTDYDAKILGQADRAIALAPDYDLPYEAKSVYLSTSRRYDEAISAANAGLAVNPNNPDFYHTRATRGNIPWPFRRGEIRFATGDSVEPA